MKLLAAKAIADMKWPKRILHGAALVLGVLTVYLLSYGPFLRVYGVKPYGGWNRLPAIVRIVYAPVDLGSHGPLARMLRGYHRWWMQIDRDRAKFLDAMARIDNSITNGMSQSEVIRLLGEPGFLWATNGGYIEGRYDYSIISLELTVSQWHTNGFIFGFTNGILVKKTPVAGMWKR